MNMGKKMLGSPATCPVCKADGLVVVPDSHGASVNHTCTDCHSTIKVRRFGTGITLEPVRRMA